MRHGIQLELEINELNETEKAVLRSIHFREVLRL